MQPLSNPVFLSCISLTDSEHPTKCLWEFLKKEREVDRPVEVFGELEMLQLPDHFFDRATYYAAIGYEKVRTEMEIESLSATA